MELTGVETQTTGVGSDIFRVADQAPGVEWAVPRTRRIIAAVQSGVPLSQLQPGIRRVPQPRHRIR